MFNGGPGVAVSGGGSVASGGPSLACSATASWVRPFRRVPLAFTARITSQPAAFNAARWSESSWLALMIEHHPYRTSAYLMPQPPGELGTLVVVQINANGRPSSHPVAPSSCPDTESRISPSG